MSRKRAVITGMGTVNPLAHDVENTWSAILSGQSGAAVNELFDASTFPSTFATQVRGYDMASQVPNADRHRHAGRHCRFALGAAVQAWNQSGLNDCDTLDRDRLGIYLGSGEGSLDFDNFTSLLVDAWRDGALDSTVWAELAFQRMDLYREIAQESNMVVSHLAAEFGVRGPAFNVLTACAASTQAIGEAAMLIRRGESTDRISDEKMAMFFQRHVQQVEAWLAEQPNIDVLYTHYNEILQDPRQHVSEINQFLGGDLDVQRMIEVVDPTLYRRRQ